MTYKVNLDAIRARAESLVKLAKECDVVLTINTTPKQPLAMGNYDMTVEVRPARNQEVTVK